MELLETQILSLLSSQLSLSIAVHDFQTNQQVFSRINKMIKTIANIQHNNYKHVTISRLVIQTVDQGKNPNKINKALVESLASQNQKSAGRVAAIEMFESDLRREIKLRFPELLDK